MSVPLAMSESMVISRFELGFDIGIAADTAFWFLLSWGLTKATGGEAVAVETVTIGGVVLGSPM
jgi:hypothetical protein